MLCLVEHSGQHAKIAGAAVLLDIQALTAWTGASLPDQLAHPVSLLALNHTLEADVLHGMV